MASSRDLSAEVRVHNRTFFMKLESNMTAQTFLQTHAKKFGISSPELFAINLPSCLDRSGNSIWLEPDKIMSPFLKEGDPVYVKHVPKTINVAVSDGTNDWVKNFEPGRPDRYDSFRYDFDDTPWEMIPAIKLKDRHQKDTLYVFMCLLIAPNYSKSSLFFL
jgi:hypothetical protein